MTKMKKSRVMPGDLVIVEPRTDLGGVGRRNALWPFPNKIPEIFERPTHGDVSGKLMTVISASLDPEHSVYVLCEGRLGWYCGDRKLLQVVSR